MNISCKILLISANPPTVFHLLLLINVFNVKMIMEKNGRGNHKNLSRNLPKIKEEPLKFSTVFSFMDYLDEGYSSPNSTMLVFNGERNIWQIEFKCPGSEGHGSLLLENTAGEKMRRLIDRLMDFRQTQVEKLNSNKNLTIGEGLENVEAENSVKL